MTLPQGLNAYDSKRREADRCRAYLQRNEELRQMRQDEDVERKQITEFVFPRRNFLISNEAGAPKAMRRRRLVDSTAMVVHERMSATIFGYLMDPATPWIRPQLLDRDMSYAEDAWADEVALIQHRYLSGSESNFRSMMAEDIDDATGFGDSIMWQAPTARGSIWLSVPNHQCAWAENEMGVVEEHYRRFPMSLRRAALRYGEKAPKLKDMAARSNRPEASEVNMLHIVEPRPGGVRGDLREVKPWTDIIICIDTMEVCEIGGHDRKPLNVGRFKRRPGVAYGRGVGLTLLPLAKLANAILEAWVRNAELTAEPPLLSMMPAGQPLDRRPGAVNHLNTLLAASMRDPKDVIQRLNVAGDIGLGADLLRLLWSKMEQAAYTDWMTPGVGPQKTATEVWDLRDTRLRTMGPIVAKIETEKMSQLAENTHEDLDAAGRLPPPPASMDGELIGYAYLGTLALAQRQSQVEGFQRYIAMAAQIVQATQNPEAGRMLKAEEVLRESADAFGVRGKFLASPDEMAAFRQGQKELGDMQQEQQAQESAGRALQAGGQGIANLASITGGAGQAAA